MVAQKISDNLEVFHDGDGEPLESGKVFIGANGLNAETNEVPVFWDKALSVAAAQPIRTVGGRPKGPDGTPGNIYVDGAYSVLVKTKADALVYTLDVDANDVDTSIADSSITNAKLADDAVGAAEVIDGSIGTNEIADDAINGSKLANGSVTEGKLADAAVTSDKIGDDEVTFAKIVAKVTESTGIPATGGDDIFPTAAAVRAFTAGSLTRATPQATTSGTAFDFTGIPAGVDKVLVFFDGVDLSGDDQILIQLGDSVGIENSGYASRSVWAFQDAVRQTSVTEGFNLWRNYSDAAVTGSATINRILGNQWEVSDTVSQGPTRGLIFVGGIKTLSNELTQLRITRNDIATFTAGQVSIAWPR